MDIRSKSLIESRAFWINATAVLLLVLTYVATQNPNVTIVGALIIPLLNVVINYLRADVVSVLPAK